MRLTLKPYRDGDALLAVARPDLPHSGHDCGFAMAALAPQALHHTLEIVGGVADG